MKIKDVKIGKKFKFGKIEFVKLDNAYGGCLCLTASVLFGDCFDNNGENDWATSTLRQKLMKVIGDYIDTSALVPFDRDLTTDDGLTDYGHCTDTVSLLTCDEYRKYRKLIPNCGEWHWTITADSLIYSYYVRFVYSDGSLHYGNAYHGDIGVRPLCVLKPDTIVELPCKVGTTIYQIYKDCSNCSHFKETGWEYDCWCDFDSEESKTMFEFDEDTDCVYIVKQTEFTYNHINGFGKDRFLTKVEAEKKLEELKNG